MVMKLVQIEGVAALDAVELALEWIVNETPEDAEEHDAPGCAGHDADQCVLCSLRALRSELLDRLEPLDYRDERVVDEGAPRCKKCGALTADDEWMNNSGRCLICAAIEERL